MTKGLVLVTGANGYIAARTVEAFLKAGYSVRGTVRKLASAAPVQQALAAYGDKLSFVEVPDITVEGAFDNAVKGVDIVAHLASPVSLFFKDTDVVRTAVRGTLTALEAAAKEPSVKHVVVMSSIVAVRGRDDGKTTYVYTEKDWNERIEAVVEQLGSASPPGAIYSASKVAAERALWKFRDEHKPRFTVAAINPVFVIGPPLVAPKSLDTLGETYESIGNMWRGGEIRAMVPGTNYYVDVRDVADLTVLAVEKAAETDGQRYIARAAAVTAQAVVDVLRKAYPERRSIIREGTPGEGYDPKFQKTPGGLEISGAKGEELLGRAYIPFGKSVLDLAKQLEALN